MNNVRGMENIKIIYKVKVVIIIIKNNLKKNELSNRNQRWAHIVIYKQKLFFIKLKTIENKK